MRWTSIAAIAAALAAAGPATLAATSAAPDSGPSLRQMAGQRIVFGFDGTSAPERLLKRIRRGEAGGVILFKRNISSRSQLRSLTKSLQDAVPAGDPPLIVSIDQEGGLVKRLSGAPEHSAAELGRENSSKLARSEGRATAKNLRGVGVNVNLAPVVDVGRPGSIMRKQERSYSGDAKKVARLAGAFARGLANGDVAATAKHFPGLGAATANEDYTVNRIDLSKDELRRKDELPFAELAADGLPLVMVSTAIYPALDDRPALFSPRISNTELRDRVGFAGASITDDLDTPSAAKYGSAQRRAYLSAHAGNDLLMFAQSYIDGTRGARELVDAIRADRLSRAGMEKAAQRVRALRESLPG
jgi:beta-N-acetylhexosaminidase